MLGRASSAERSSSPRYGQGERLAERRRLRRRRMIFAFCFLALLVLGVIMYGLWQSSVRISRIQIFGADESLSSYAAQAMRGSYLGIIPRDSIFFFPEGHIRADLIAAHPEVAAVSVFRNGFTGLSIKVNSRVPVARWCGGKIRSDLNASSSRSDLVSSECYFFDAKGFIYMATNTAIGSSTPLNSFMVYESFANENSPIGATLPNATDLPSAFDFARQLSTLGSPVISISFRNDEVDDYLASGTRITYVLGDEQNAFTALMSARSNLNLADGSLEYVDVRFDGKVYSKKK